MHWASHTKNLRSTFMPSFTKTLLSSTLTTKALHEATELPCVRGSCLKPLKKSVVRLPNERSECPRTTVARRLYRPERSDTSPNGRRFVQRARQSVLTSFGPWSKPKAQQPLLLQWKALLGKLWRASNGKAQVNGLSKLLTQLTKASPLKKDGQNRPS